ncbi:MAG TPA: SDR family NAD(P)-dependent oxidoreductase [Trebonia sp.]|jgi:NAD(P)-dependent dehydrogenase (short-subunit alcohol dehydrogenase family)|nr:SDR family NAD(P)-dependent oxidoreductase [Trebonia sp.]
MSGLRLDGRVAAVTGAGRGIGRAYALLLGQLGASVVVNDLGGTTLGTGADPTPADEVVKQINAAGGTAVASYGDVSTAEGGRSVIDTAVEQFGTIDIVVNNAGNMVWGSLPEATIETIEAHWAVHVRGSFHTLHAAWPHFLQKNYGRAILTTSVGMFGLMDNIGYAIAKASMIGMAKSLTVSRKDANININCIAPNALTRLASRSEEEQAQLPPPSAEMDPANAAPMVAYLAHESCQVSGEVYLAGGGRFARLFVGVTEGYLHPGLTGSTVDDVAANWATINDETGYYVPSDLMDWAGHYMSHLKR